MNVDVIISSKFKRQLARVKLFTAIMRYDGKDVDAFVAATTKKPPILNKYGEGNRRRAGFANSFRWRSLRLRCNSNPVEQAVKRQWAVPKGGPNYCVERTVDAWSIGF